MADQDVETIARRWVEECTGATTDVGKGLRQIIAKLDWHIKMDELEWPPYEEEVGGAISEAPLDPRRLLNRSEAAEYLTHVIGFETARATLAKYASTGGGPIMTYIGRKPFYSTPDLTQWVMGKTRRSSLSRDEEGVGSEAFGGEKAK